MIPYARGLASGRLWLAPTARCPPIPLQSQPTPRYAVAGGTTAILSQGSRRSPRFPRKPLFVVVAVVNRELQLRVGQDRPVACYGHLPRYRAHDVPGWRAEVRVVPAVALIAPARAWRPGTSERLYD